jgi:hypothetical protein
MGGLGNQLFIIFTTISCAIQNNTSFSFPKEFGPNGSSIKRYPYWNTFLQSLASFATSDQKPCALFKEGGFHYHPIPTFGQQNTMLLGYYQSPRYFVSHFETICRMIRYKETCEKIREKYKDKYPIFGDKNTISMHFRLGDYKGLQEYHAILSKEYYKRAILHILASVEENQTIYYFCEAADNADVTPVIKELELMYGEKARFVKVADSLEDWEQMILMSFCQHHIIANSTFSWWGAYFSRVFSLDSITCYPKIWFGPNLKHYYLGDLFPKEWICIE